MKQDIVIYNDEGVGEFGLRCLREFFKDHDVWLADANAVIDGTVLGLADLFVMPGGADLPYCKKLNGEGNENIRAFVETGGTYLGICAGAYYGCAALEFHKGRADEISGPRELALADATAYGSLPDLAPYYDLTLASAAAVELTLDDGSSLHSFYHGGPAFRIPEGNETKIHARYKSVEGQPPAIIETKFGEGRAILSGVHWEMSLESLPDWPYETDAEKPLMEKILRTLSRNKAKPQHILSAILESCAE